MEAITWLNARRQVSDLMPADYNPREMTDLQRSDLTRSVQKFDAVEPVVVNTGSRANVIIGGHQRVKIYADLGFAEIDVRVPNRELTVEEEMELNIRLNKNVGMWNQDKLQGFDRDLLTEAGFQDHELLFAPKEPNTDFTLPGGDKGNLEQITFTLAKEQALYINQAIKGITKFAKKFGNENKNGNAIYTLVKQWAELKRLK